MSAYLIKASGAQPVTRNHNRPGDPGPPVGRRRSL